MKTVKLKGPKEIHRQFEVDGVQYLAANGTVTPDLPEGKVPDNLFGLGFVVVSEEVSEKASKHLLKQE